MPTAKLTTSRPKPASTAVYETEPKNTTPFPITMELLAILVICGVGVLLIFIGVAYKLFCARKVEEEISPEEGEEENEKLNTDRT